MRLLSLGTYPITVPRHGGQIRVSALHRILRESGWNTRHIAVYPDRHYDGEPTSEWNVCIPERLLRRLHTEQGRVDVDAADFLIEDERERAVVSTAIDRFRPDVILLEQCWLWPFVRLYREERNAAHVPVVYSSQNVEQFLMPNLVADLDPHARDRLVRKTRDIETDLLRHASGVIAVSQADAEAFRAECRDVLVATNGVWPRQEATNLEDWSRRLKAYSVAVFVGSAHPPNASGFATMVGPSLAYLAPDERVVAIGGVCSILDEVETYAEHRGVNAARVVRVGVQDGGSLSALIELCDLILLPIAEGGGTNLKTAEALYNRKPIVGTSLAFRGYESFARFPGVHVCDEPERFKRTIVEIFRGGNRLPRHSVEQVQELNQLLWSTTLAQVPEFLLRRVDRDELATNSAPAWATRTRSARRHIPGDVVTSDNLATILSGGWYQLEAGGVWSRDTVAILTIGFEPNVPMPMTVALNLRRVPGSGVPTRVRIYSPVALRASAKIDTDEPCVMECNIEAGDLYEDGSTELFVQVAGLVSPKELGLFPDERRLGVRLERLEIRDAVERFEIASPEKRKFSLSLPLKRAIRTTRLRKAREKDLALIKPLFDAAYYLEQYPDVARSGRDPLEHFLSIGAAETRKPNAFFDPRWYIQEYPDVGREGSDPLIHYLNYGWREGRHPGPDFNVRQYLLSYPDVVQSGMEPLTHYLAVGRAEKRTVAAVRSASSRAPAGQ